MGGNNIFFNNSSISDLYRKLLMTAEENKLKVLSDEICCQLLAVLFIYGGEREIFVVDHRLSTDILASQKRLNLEGGDEPDALLSKKLQQYIRELEQCSKPLWLIDLEKRYQIKILS